MLAPTRPAGEPPAQTAETIVVMAQVVGSYGVRGWLRVRPYTEEPGALLGFARWWLRRGEGAPWREYALAEGREHSGALLAQLDGVATREEALALRGAQVGVARSALPAPGDDAIYWTDLVGLAVVNREGVALGRVVAVQDFGAHPVLRVVPEGEANVPERLVPFVAAHVDRVDLPARRIEVDWQPDY